NISYPTVVARLNEVVKTMGYEVGDTEMSEVDQYEYYEAQVIKPQAQRPIMPMPPMAPMAPPVPAPPAPNAPTPPKMSAEQRQKILDDLAAGKITAQDAMKKIYG
ncbi:MAG: hypothetical protein ABIQ44_00870, partial [Chloroflexia bacterium]